VITGDGRSGAALVQHPTSTRSRSPDRPTWAASSASRPRAAASRSRSSSRQEPFIVFEDADLDSVVEAWWMRSGSTRAGVLRRSRLLVQEGVAERLLAKLRARMEKLRLGSPLDKAVDMGAIVAPVQLERIRTS